MKTNFVRTKVMILISIFLISSFGLYVTGIDDTFEQPNVELEQQQDEGTRKVSWDPPPYEVYSRATAPMPGSRIMNDGDDTYGYFLGEVSSADFTNSYSTLDNYLTIEDLASVHARDKPVFPGSCDIVYELDVESINVRDNNGTDGDEMLYHTKVSVDYTDVELRDESDWSWDSVVGAEIPFTETTGSEPNIFDSNGWPWIQNNLTIAGKPAYEYDADYNHSFARYRVHDDNTIADTDWVGEDGVGSGTSSIITTPESLNNSINYEFFDLGGDVCLNTTTDPDNDVNMGRDLIQINTDRKTFKGFTMDVKPDAEPGVYRFKVKISYDYQTYVPVVPYDEVPMPDGIPAGNLHNTGIFGDFEPYFWIPWNSSSQQPVANLTGHNAFYETYECTFKKVNTYDKGGTTRDQDSEVNGKSSWEPIQDLSTTKGSFEQLWLDKYVDWDMDDFDDSDGNPLTVDKYEMWNYRWTPVVTNTPIYPGGGMEKFEDNWNFSKQLVTSFYETPSASPSGADPGWPIADQDYGFYGSRTTTPDPTKDDGNGTWQHYAFDDDWKEDAPGGSSPSQPNNDGNCYAGYDGDIVWQSAEEEYWVLVRIFSGTVVEELENDEDGLILKAPSDASDDYVTDGDQFEEFVISLENSEYDHYSSVFDFEYLDIYATLDLGEYTDYFNLHGPEGLVGKAYIKNMTEEKPVLRYRLDSKPDTPPGYYYFNLHWEYTKTYYLESPMNDPRNDVVVYVSETTLVQFYVEFSPDLAVTDAKLAATPGMRALNPRFTIDTGTNKTLINFTIENTGNVELVGDAQYAFPNANNYDDVFGDIGMFIAGVELLGQPYYEEDEIPGQQLLFDIEPIMVPIVGVGESIDIEVPVKIGFNWDNMPGIYRVHLNFRGFYYDPGNVSAASTSSKYVYTEILWDEPNGPGMKDECWVYRDTDASGKIETTDPKDKTDGIYTDIEIVPFQPESRELGINSFKIAGVTSGKITQGTTQTQIEVEFINNGDYDMYEIELMLGIGAGTGMDYFSVFSHYDIDQEGKIDTSLLVMKDYLMVGDTFNHTFTINGIDRLTPTGWHHLPLTYTYAFEELPSFWSVYGIAWTDVGGRYRGFIDEMADGYDVGDNHRLYDEYKYEGGYLAIEVIEDLKLDVIATQRMGPGWGATPLTGDSLDLGAAIRNNDIVIELTSREYVDYTQVETYLDCWAPNPTGTGMVQILENPITLDGERIKGVFDVPANDVLKNKSAAAFNYVTFNVNLKDPAPITDGGVFPFNLTIAATNDDTNTRAEYTTTVNVRVMPVEPLLMVADVSWTTIEPGEDFTLTVTIRNEGEDTAREVYVTLSNDWYQDDPFYLVDAFVTSTSEYWLVNNQYSPSGNTPRADGLSSEYFYWRNSSMSLADLGIDHTTDIVDAERVLMSPASKINRMYISEIAPHTTAQVTYQLRADTHMQEGKAYDEIVILEFRDSYGMERGYFEGSGAMSTTGNPRYGNSMYTSKMAFPITLVTDGNDKWPPTTEAEIEEKAAAQFQNVKMSMIAIILILIILLIVMGALYSRRRKEALEEEGPEEEYIPPPEDEEEMEEEEEVGPPSEEEEEEEAAEGEEEEEEWGAPEDEEEEEKPEEEEEEEEWGASEEEEEEKAEEEEEWSEESKEEEEEEEEDWSK